MATVLVSTHGTNGDVLPLIRVGRELAGRGHDVSVMTHAWFADRVAAAGLRHVPIDTDEAYDRHLDDTGRFMLDPLRDPEGVLELYRRNKLFEQLRDEVEMIRQRYRPGETVVLARHTSGIAALIAAELYGVPVATQAMAPCQYVTLPVTHQVYRHVLEAGFDDLFGGFGLEPVRDWVAYLNSARVQLGGWPGWFDAAGDPTPDAVLKCGFILGDTAGTTEGAAQDTAPPDWPEPPVLITGGTGLVLHRPFYEVAARACHRAGRPALLVTRHRSLVPDPLPEGVRWLPSAPFAALMPYVSAVVHHGGMGTLGRALASATPQVMLAHGVDRPDNAERMERAGLCRWLPVSRWEEKPAVDLLTEVLQDTGYRERVAPLAAETASDAAVRTAADRVEGLIGTDGILTRPGLRQRLGRLTPQQRARLAAMLTERAGSRAAASGTGERPVGSGADRGAGS
ncbi:glycosyltransferase [Planobispora takensis]|uniref:Glucosyltransferase n=1 Tax=Planobispora takensis TaxID=1367882 RepID=A0A8J3WV44_9ACTN|nr:nucleotide disphospho-sugar-binding domain-containing protein [Planobispora takensis]GII03579.1 glucosyltransferase [Planobispora takensis]